MDQYRKRLGIMHATHPHSSIRDSVHAHNPPRIGMYQLINQKAGPLFTMGGCTLFPWYGYVVDLGNYETRK